MLNSKLTKQFKDTIKKDFPFLLHQPVLLACSGGLDSMALFHLIRETAKETGITLHVASINHNMRENAQQDILFVKKICKQNNIPFYTATIEKKYWEEITGSKEDAARKKRYLLLDNILKTENINYLLTAHHLDDQIETILMRLFDRGTGAKGLVGIRDVISDHIKTVCRPLLSYSRETLASFMKQHQHIEDETNKDINIRRNFYRHTIIPNLDTMLSETYKQNIYRLSQNMAREQIFLQKLSQQFWRQFIIKNNNGLGGYRIDRATVEKYDNKFWITAFSHFFNIHHDYSHNTKALHDLVQFISKKEPAECHYNPFIFKRTRDYILIVNNL